MFMTAFSRLSSVKRHRKVKISIDRLDVLKMSVEYAAEALSLIFLT